MMKRFSILIVAVLVVTAVFGQSADQWLKQGNDYYEKQQFSKAVECYQQAAEAGSQEGQFNLGYALYNGEGIDKDYATAAMWFKRAARKGFAKAQYNLAYCYMYGRGVPIDYDKALRNLTDAANNGNKNAQLTLAECYEKGVLVMQDKKMSQLWKDKAAGKHAAAIPMQEVEDVKPAVAATTPPPAPKPTPTPVEKPVEQPVVAQQPPTPAPQPAVGGRPVPPEVRILFPEDQSPFHTDVIKLRYQLLAQGLEASTRITVMVDGQKQPADRAVRAANTVEVDLPNRDCTVTIYAQNENGNSEPASIRLIREKQVAELPRLFAVAIGVGDYNDPELPKLKYTTKDARDFSKVLSTKKDYPYQDVQVKTICDEEATREDFYEAMEWLKQESSPTDVCIFFYAGHGYRDEKDRFYFMNYGSSTSKLYNCFSSNDFRQAVEDINGKLIVFVDACYSGALMGGNRSAASNHFVEQLRRTKNGMVMYASSASDTKSKENEDWKNGAFTKALVDAFNGAARTDGDIGLSTQQLDQYLYKAVRQMTDFKQTPIFMNPNGMEPFELFTYEK
ncbi:MAG: caspase family protein [Prevotella sp.]|nr:caspase family protein [Prevotella sp.]MBP5355728.1 caspase family protein [Prevotella sp.]